MTIIEFLHARLDEDHEAAFGAAPSPWIEGAGWDGTLSGARPVLDRHGEITAHAYYGGTYGHVIRFDPSRMLRDVAAKRRLVDAFDDDGWCIDGGAVYTDFALRALAAAYADHPDYDPAWEVQRHG